MKKLTFKDINKNYITHNKDKFGNDIKLLDLTTYEVNKCSGELKVFEPNTLQYFHNPYNHTRFCQIGSFWTNGIHFIVDFGEENNTSVKGCVASSHILFLDKEDAKQFSIEIFTKMKDRLNAKIEKVRNL